MPSMGVVAYKRLAHLRARWPGVLGAALAIGLIGGVALAALAGARRTASTFGAYERDTRLSHMAVNTFTPDLERVDAISALPGVESSATYVGLDGYPIVDGRVIDDFRFTGVFGSLDGRFFTQDRATVIEGRLPDVDAVDELALTPEIADEFGVGVGDDLTYELRPQEGANAGASAPARRSTFRVVGLVRLPPVLVDENDIIAGSILPPAATRANLDTLVYAWQGLRLDHGVAGIDALVDELVADKVAGRLPPVIQRYDETRSQVQRAVRPQAISLALFGAAALVAAFALGSQSLARLLAPGANDALALRAIGASRRQAALVIGADALLAVAAGALIAVIAAVALSPLAPVGAVRQIAPDTGIEADWTVLLAVGAGMAIVLGGFVAAGAWRLVGTDDRAAAAPTSTTASAFTRLGLPPPVTIGARFALERPRIRSGATSGITTLAAGAFATVAVVAAAVFGSSLGHLVSTPSQYGWVFDRMLIAQAGYGSLDPGQMSELLASEPGIERWSLLGFESVLLSGRATPLPAMTVFDGTGELELPLLEGRMPEQRGEVALGAGTMRDLRKHLGDTISVEGAAGARDFEIVGSVTLPSIGQGGANHTSLGRGLLFDYDDLADTLTPGVDCLQTEEALCGRALVFDAKRGVDDDAIVARLRAANPDGLEGGTYEQPVTRAADIRNYDQMRRMPSVLALVLALAAMVWFWFTILASARDRARTLATLRAIGFTPRQLAATMASSAALIALLAVTIGVPLGVAAGRVAWRTFALSLGVVPRPVVSVPAVSVGTIAAVVAAGVTSLPITRHAVSRARRLRPVE